MNKPEHTEYHPNFSTYIGLATTSDQAFIDLLADNTQKTEGFFGTIPAAKHNYAYDTGKWTSKEVLMHLIDTERVFAYRVLVCVRGDGETPLNRVDENLYAANADVSDRTMENLIEEFAVVRRNTHFLFKNITEEQSKFLGNGWAHKISARALGYAIVGHCMHHLNVMQERYLNS